MVLNTNQQELIKTNALDTFDSIVKIAFSNDANDEASSSDVLTGEFLRKDLDEKIKQSSIWRYNFEGILGLTEGNGQTLNKVGYFEGTGDSLIISRQLDTGISKTSDVEINIGFELNVELTDNTK